MAAPERTPPLRWVSPAERAWDSDAVWKAFLELLEQEPLELLGERQRPAHFVHALACAVRTERTADYLQSLSAPQVQETLTALRALGADAHAACLERAARRPRDAAGELATCADLFEPLRRHLDAFEPYFVRVARPSCT